RPPSTTLFPYTTLFRSPARQGGHRTATTCHRAEHRAGHAERAVPGLCRADRGDGAAAGCRTGRAKRTCDRNRRASRALRAAYAGHPGDRAFAHARWAAHHLGDEPAGLMAGTPTATAARRGLTTEV